MTRNKFAQPHVLECPTHGEFETWDLAGECPKCEEEWAQGNALPF